MNIIKRDGFGESKPVTIFVGGKSDCQYHLLELQKLQESLGFETVLHDDNYLETSKTYNLGKDDEYEVNCHYHIF